MKPQSALKTTITLRLPQELVRTAEEAVMLGLAASTTAFIEEALRARSRDVRHARMRRLADEAMSDPGFVADMLEVSEAFAASQADEWPIEHSELSKSTFLPSEGARNP